MVSFTGTLFGLLTVAFVGTSVATNATTNAAPAAFHVGKGNCVDNSEESVGGGRNNLLNTTRNQPVHLTLSSPLFLPLRTTLSYATLHAAAAADTSTGAHHGAHPDLDQSTNQAYNQDSSKQHLSRNPAPRGMQTRTQPTSKPRGACEHDQHPVAAGSCPCLY